MLARCKWPLLRFLGRPKQFEYKTVDGNLDDVGLQELNALGKERWELCCCDNFGLVYLKREVRNEPKR